MCYYVIYKVNIFICTGMANKITLNNYNIQIIFVCILYYRA